MRTAAATVGMAVIATTQMSESARRMRCSSSIPASSGGETSSRTSWNLPFLISSTTWSGSERAKAW